MQKSEAIYTLFIGITHKIYIAVQGFRDWRHKKSNNVRVLIDVNPKCKGLVRT